MWVPIALSLDVPPGTTRAILLGGRELVAWRAGDGTAQIWEDRCPHRGMRLSFGFVRGNSLNCLYHGWEYGSHASCVRIPAHPDLQVPPTIRATALPVAETGGMIWTSTSNGDEAPPQLAGGRPLASIAVDAEIDWPTSGAQLVDVTLSGLSFQIGWHRQAPQRSMLHACIESDADPVIALGILRTLRATLEQDAAA
jgi:phenylpropionate dioxygenase-like ring-hydroxylating dioxygenase large terminal subunit